MSLIAGRGCRWPPRRDSVSPCAPLSGGGRDTHDGHENSPILVFFSNLLGGVRTHAERLFPAQGKVGRFVRHVHRRIIRIRLTEPAGDLLGRPLARELGGHRVTQRGVRRQATPLGPPAARPRRRVGRGRPIPPPPSVPAYLPDSPSTGPGAAGG